MRTHFQECANLQVQKQQTTHQFNLRWMMIVSVSASGSHKNKVLNDRFFWGRAGETVQGTRLIDPRTMTKIC